MGNAPLQPSGRERSNPAILALCFGFVLKCAEQQAGRSEIREQQSSKGELMSIGTDCTETRFAPAHRAERETLQRQLGYFSTANLTRHLLDAVPNILLILNETRQIVYSNQALLDLVGVTEANLLYGKRPGEVLECTKLATSLGGCGTGEACRTCGAVLAILAGLEGNSVARECSISRHVGGRIQHLNLCAWVTPIEFDGEKFCVFALTDISHEKRRRSLERIFFHDILNIAGSIRGFAEFLRAYDPEDKKAIFDRIHATAERIIDEIESQKTISAAESQELRVQLKLIGSRTLLEKNRELFCHQELAKDRHLVVEPDCEELLFLSDDVLIGRVLGNMIKNALEASLPGEFVTLGCSQVENRVEFRVHNPAVISREGQAQIFHRSFSTKGEGRGLGTYSMKLLSDFLRGEVSFTSSEGVGTTFRARYPLS
jgi:nitrogen-specific signal transduction histidine kinase